jgi:hypothetical protein
LGSGYIPRWTLIPFLSDLPPPFVIKGRLWFKSLYIQSRAIVHAKKGIPFRALLLLLGKEAVGVESLTVLEQRMYASDVTPTLRDAAAVLIQRFYRCARLRAMAQSRSRNRWRYVRQRMRGISALRLTLGSAGGQREVDGNPSPNEMVLDVLESAPMTPAWSGFLLKVKQLRKDALDDPVAYRRYLMLVKTALGLTSAPREDIGSFSNSPRPPLIAPAAPSPRQSPLRSQQGDSDGVIRARKRSAPILPPLRDRNLRRVAAEDAVGRERRSNSNPDAPRRVRPGFDVAESSSAQR